MVVNNNLINIIREKINDELINNPHEYHLDLIPTEVINEVLWGEMEDDPEVLEIAETTNSSIITVECNIILVDHFAKEHIYESATTTFELEIVSVGNTFEVKKLKRVF